MGRLISNGCSMNIDVKNKATVSITDLYIFFLIKHEWENLVLPLLWGNIVAFCQFWYHWLLMVRARLLTACHYFALGSNFSKVHVTLGTDTGGLP